ncbi:MAG TPA: class II glutamine amidotransferase [Candidatus Brachybacterium merdavium]|uniref:Class II glutamine amidotransferase n=1 Tax=Candidatus Brachybacterium merdavium TaxID=2838513 RepID=A0A9D2RPP5_9MICO|nr:class II glutamine amidotransferase [Candidatus Brachybacterium merdavium]
MCRLFALRSDQPVTADLWLLDAPYSLLHQSRFNADGTGLGWIDERGQARLRKRPVAAFESEAFTQVATTLRARSMMAHVRLSSGTEHCEENTHPFLQDGILSAHNGVLMVTEEMRQRVRELDAGHHVHGTTDSEWLAALVTGEVAAHGGNLRAGVVSALSWTIAHVPVYSVNLLVMTDTELIAVRLPATNELWVLERAATAEAPREPLEQSSDSLRARSEGLRDTRSVVVASEPMDDDPAWRLMDSGELIHLGADGTLRSEHPFGPLAHALSLEELGLSAAASQAHAAQAREQEHRRRRLAEVGA